MFLYLTSSPHPLLHPSLLFSCGIVCPPPPTPITPSDWLMLLYSLCVHCCYYTFSYIYFCIIFLVTFVLQVYHIPGPALCVYKCVTMTSWCVCVLMCVRIFNVCNSQLLAHHPLQKWGAHFKSRHDCVQDYVEYNENGVCIKATSAVQ